MRIQRSHLTCSLHPFSSNARRSSTVSSLKRCLSRSRNIFLFDAFTWTLANLCIFSSSPFIVCNSWRSYHKKLGNFCFAKNRVGDVSSRAECRPNIEAYAPSHHTSISQAWEHSSMGHPVRTIYVCRVVDLWRIEHTKLDYVSRRARLHHKSNNNTPHRSLATASPPSASLGTFWCEGWLAVPYSWVFQATSRSTALTPKCAKLWMQLLVLWYSSSGLGISRFHGHTEIYGPTPLHC